MDMEALADKAVNTLIGRATTAHPLSHAALDLTTLGWPLDSYRA